MNATLIGADRLGNIPEVLKSRGLHILQHVSGRSASAQRQGCRLPKGTQLLILFTDFLGHNVMHSFRKAAQQQGIRVVACRRSVSSLLRSLDGLGRA